MWEGLVDYIENTIFKQINLIKDHDKKTFVRIENLIYFLLAFSEKNPGITRILTGDALLGEHERLQLRMSHIFSKLENQIKQILREKPMIDGDRLTIDEGAIANLLLAFVEGKMNQFVRSQFKQKPTKNFKLQWQFFHNQLIHSTKEM